MRALQCAHTTSFAREIDSDSPDTAKNHSRLPARRRPEIETPNFSPFRSSSTLTKQPPPSASGKTDSLVTVSPMRSPSAMVVVAGSLSEIDQPLPTLQCVWINLVAVYVH